MYSPISQLSGNLIVEGLGQPFPTAARSEATLNTRLPYVGATIGEATAEPGLVAFGRVRDGGIEGGAAAGKADLRRRTRWILLTCTGVETAREASGIRRRLGKPAGLGTRGYWQRASVSVDSCYFQVSLVSPNVRSAGAAGDEPGRGGPLSVSRRLMAGAACWLKVTLLPSAVHARPLVGMVTIALPDKERLRLPILAERE